MALVQLRALREESSAALALIEREAQRLDDAARRALRGTPDLRALWVSPRFRQLVGAPLPGASAGPTLLERSGERQLAAPAGAVYRMSGELIE